MPGGLRHYDDVMLASVQESGFPVDQSFADGAVYEPGDLLTKAQEVLKEKRLLVLTGAMSSGKTVLARTIAHALDGEGWQVFFLDPDPALPDVPDAASGSLDRDVVATSCSAINAVDGKKVLIVLDDPRWARLRLESMEAIAACAGKASHAWVVATARRASPQAAEAPDGEGSGLAEEDRTPAEDDHEEWAADPFAEWPHLKVNPTPDTAIEMARSFLKAKGRTATGEGTGGGRAPHRQQLSADDEAWVRETFATTRDLRDLRECLNVWSEAGGGPLREIDRRAVLRKRRSHVLSQLGHKKVLHEMLLRVAAVFQFDVPYQWQSPNLEELKHLEHLHRLGLLHQRGNLFYLSHSSDAIGLVEAEADARGEDVLELTRQYVAEYLKQGAVNTTDLLLALLQQQKTRILGKMAGNEGVFKGLVNNALSSIPRLTATLYALHAAGAAGRVLDLWSEYKRLMGGDAPDRVRALLAGLAEVPVAARAQFLSTLAQAVPDDSGWVMAAVFRGDRAKKMADETANFHTFFHLTRAIAALRLPVDFVRFVDRHRLSGDPRLEQRPNLLLGVLANCVRCPEGREYAEQLTREMLDSGAFEKVVAGLTLSRRQALYHLVKQYDRKRSCEALLAGLDPRQLAHSNLRAARLSMLSPICQESARGRQFMADLISELGRAGKLVPLITSVGSWSGRVNLCWKTGCMGSGELGEIIDHLLDGIDPAALTNSRGVLSKLMYLLKACVKDDRAHGPARELLRRVAVQGVLATVLKNHPRRAAASFLRLVEQLDPALAKDLASGSGLADPLRRRALSLDVLYGEVRKRTWDPAAVARYLGQALRGVDLEAWIEEMCEDPAFVPLDRMGKFAKMLTYARGQSPELISGVARQLEHAVDLRQERDRDPRALGMLLARLKTCSAESFEALCRKVVAVYSPADLLRTPLDTTHVYLIDHLSCAFPEEVRPHLDTLLNRDLAELLWSNSSLEALGVALQMMRRLEPERTARWVCGVPVQDWVEAMRQQPVTGAGAGAGAGGGAGAGAGAGQGSVFLALGTLAQIEPAVGAQITLAVVNKVISGKAKVKPELLGLALFLGLSVNPGTLPLSVHKFFAENRAEVKTIPALFACLAFLEVAPELHQEFLTRLARRDFIWGQPLPTEDEVARLFPAAAGMVKRVFPVDRIPTEPSSTLREMEASIEKHVQHQGEPLSLRRLYRTWSSAGEEHLFTSIDEATKWMDIARFLGRVRTQLVRLPNGAEAVSVLPVR